MPHFACFLISITLFSFYLVLYQTVPDIVGVRHDTTSTLSSSTPEGRYEGIEVQTGRLSIDPILYTASSKTWALQGLHYQGYTLDLNFTQTSTVIRVVLRGRKSTLFVEGDNGRPRKPVGEEFTLERRKFHLTVVPSDLYDEHWSQVPYQFESRKLPEQKYMPEVGNGHIATVVNGPNVFVNGLFNGLGPKSSRAKIPSLVAFQLRTNHSKEQLIQETYTLDVRRGTFKEVKVYAEPGMTIEREIFAHRELDRLLVSVVTITRNSTSSGEREDSMLVWIDGLPDTRLLKSSDITFQQTTNNRTTSGIDYNTAVGQTNTPEVPDLGKVLPVALAWSSDVRNVSIEPGSTVTMSSVVAISVLSDDAVTALTAALSMPRGKLIQRHSAKWESYWNSGFIYVDPNENFQLAQAIYGSFYYLLSSLPNEQDPKNRFIGLSPGGLARGADNSDYSGHVFWDQDIWMYPPILSFYPDIARVVVESRTQALAAAKANAVKYGFKGAKYPWESAFSGTETSPWPPSGLYEIHVTADAAFAVRQLVYATDDKVGIIRQLKLDEWAIEVALFWQSRVECSQEADQCSILNVMPPDEYHFPVNDSVYTNYAVRLSLELPAYILSFTGGSHPDLPLWAHTAQRLTYPTSVTPDGRQFHLEFNGFTPGVVHPRSRRNTATVKQADVILLGYPLGMEMSSEMRKADLDVYLPITVHDGPAMTWGMFALGYLELDLPNMAAPLFEKNYDNIVQPFGVWSEDPGGGGALNFLTGMGGFLQAIVNGYGGIRLLEDRVTLHPQPLPHTTTWKLIGYRHLGYQIDIIFDFTRRVMSFQTTAKNSTTHLVLELESEGIYDLSTVGQPFEVHLEKSVIRVFNPTVDALISIPVGKSASHAAFHIFPVIRYAVFVVLICFLLRFLFICKRQLEGFLYSKGESNYRVK
ncbi:Acid trehalase-like protein 1 [Hypsibius exemplaris]|uniref:Protein-glucosylgalactosylhydroxylysine glucosidase n=1 Tax=Hypsibius exemplaris TaxID=2072580 RepID=A0A1W0WRW9_HYPEX|nr:Acid trehalase-like protein 1 [Hypsibius exemplaris]